MIHLIENNKYLLTDYKRKNLYKDKFNFLEPKAILLNKIDINLDVFIM